MYLITEGSLELRPKVDDDGAGAAVLGPGSGARPSPRGCWSLWGGFSKSGVVASPPFWQEGTSDKRCACRDFDALPRLSLEFSCNSERGVPRTIGAASSEALRSQLQLLPYRGRHWQVVSGFSLAIYRSNTLLRCANHKRNSTDRTAAHVRPARAGMLHSGSRMIQSDDHPGNAFGYKRA